MDAPVRIKTRNDSIDFITKIDRFSGKNIKKGKTTQFSFIGYDKNDNKYKITEESNCYTGIFSRSIVPHGK